LLWKREIAFYDSGWKRAMLPPLHIDHGSAARCPRGVQCRTVPECPQVRGHARRVVSHPDDFLVSGNRKRDPGTVNVIAPQQVIRDDPSCWMNDGHDALEREVFVALEEEHRRESTNE